MREYDDKEKNRTVLIDGKRLDLTEKEFMELDKGTRWCVGPDGDYFFQGKTVYLPYGTIAAKDFLKPILYTKELPKYNALMPREENSKILLELWSVETLQKWWLEDSEPLWEKSINDSKENTIGN